MVLRIIRYIFRVPRLVYKSTTVGTSVHEYILVREEMQSDRYRKAILSTLSITIN